MAQATLHKLPHTRPARNASISTNFNETEFDCKCGGAYCDGIQPEGMDERVIVWLQAIRDAAGKPIKIISGYRCPQHNKNQGGKPKSFHKKGMAADFMIMGAPVATAHKLAQDTLTTLQKDNPRFKGLKGGIGYYTRHRFVHIDTGKRMWRQTF